jgi:hypothetical protein
VRVVDSGVAPPTVSVNAFKCELLIFCGAIVGVPVAADADDVATAAPNATTPQASKNLRLDMHTSHFVDKPPA